VKVLITIPTMLYYELLRMCDVSSQEYRTLKNGVIRDIDDEEDETVVYILCHSEHAKTLLACANKVDPSAASKITVDAPPDN
jgi:hypothetical protein